MAPIAKSEITKDRVLAACRKLFYEKGCTETTMRDISEESGVLLGSIHYQFGKKEQLKRAILDEEIERLYAEAEAIVRRDEDSLLHYLIVEYIIFYKCFADERYRRFSAEFDRTDFDSVEYASTFYSAIMGNRAITPQDIVSSELSSSVDLTLVRMMHSDFPWFSTIFDYRSAAEKTIEATYFLFGIDPEATRDVIRRGRDIVDGLDLSVLPTRLD